MRLFVAVNFPLSIKNELGRNIDKLKKDHTNVRWTKVENIHITLKFLGDVPDTRLDEIKLVLQNVVKDFGKFQVSINGIGCFPSVESPRIVWAGIQEGARELSSLAVKIEEELEKLGFARENRPFAPHATIGRVKIGKKAVIDISLPFLTGPFIVEGFELMESILTSNGPEYEVAETFKIG